MTRTGTAHAPSAPVVFQNMLAGALVHKADVSSAIATRYGHQLHIICPPPRFGLAVAVMPGGGVLRVGSACSRAASTVCHVLPPAKEGDWVVHSYMLYPASRLTIYIGAGGVGVPGGVHPACHLGVHRRRQAYRPRAGAVVAWHVRQRAVVARVGRVEQRLELGARFPGFLGGGGERGVRREFRTHTHSPASHASQHHAHGFFRGRPVGRLTPPGR
eukprot:COSAG01_NODE_2277_length_8010_cov_15.062571_3_plen_216_part_00